MLSTAKHTDPLRLGQHSDDIDPATKMLIFNRLLFDDFLQTMRPSSDFRRCFACFPACIDYPLISRYDVCNGVFGSFFVHVDTCDACVSHGGFTIQDSFKLSRRYLEAFHCVQTINQHYALATLR